MTNTRFTLDDAARSVWRVTFNNPPINLIDSVLIAELRELFTVVEQNKALSVMVFDSGHQP